MSRRFHTSWYGLFAHPILDRDIFEELPYIRQREILAVTYGGTSPDLSCLSKSPFWFFVSIPDSVSLTFLVKIKVEYERRNVMNRIEDLSVSETAAIIDILQKHVTLSKLIETCTVHGKGERIKTNKPVDGVYAYIWRMARFNDNSDPCMPITAFWDLEAGLRKLTGKEVSFTFIHEGQKTICDWLDKWSVKLIEQVGGDPLAGALRWGRASGLVL